MRERRGFEIRYCCQFVLRHLDKYIYICAENNGGQLPILDGVFFDLSQNPESRPAMTCQSLPTLRRNTCLWDAGSKRLVSPQELACAMGFPVFSACAARANVPIDLSPSDWSLSTLGNTMHVACVGTVLAAALSCCCRV